MPARSAIPVAITAAAILALAACGSTTSTKAAAPASGPAAEVPAAIKAKGTLVVASDATYAPNEFIDKDGTTVIGMDADLIKAIASELDLKVDIQNVTFDNIIPGIQAGRYDVGMSSFTDTKAREKVVDFVDYFTAGSSFFTKAGAPTVTGLSDLCGVAVSVEKGTVQQMDATTQSAACTKAGKKAVNLLVFNDQTGANLALSTGRATVSIADSPVAAYQVKQSNGAFALSGSAYGAAPYGIALPKGNGMAKPVEDAVSALIANGDYLKILTTWGVQSGAVTTSGINGATS